MPTVVLFSDWIATAERVVSSDSNADRQVGSHPLMDPSATSHPPVASRQMTVKEHLQQVVADMTEEEAAQALALVAGARAGATPIDLYGAAWGQVLADTDPGVLASTGVPSIAIPDGIPPVR